MQFCSMDPKFERQFVKKLEARKEKNTFRQLPKENDRIDFSSNDYLGFATDGLLEHSFLAKEKFSGATASRLISGNSKLHESVEQMIADYHHANTGLLFNSGYDANVGVLGCIAQKGDTILYDELCHASILDGLKMSLANSTPFIHNDLKDLEKNIENSKGNIFIVTEGIFSMDGDTSPLMEMVGLSKKYKAAIIIDEAHSTGILGKQGKGWVCELGLEDEILVRVHTFGKAMGCHGAIVLGSQALRDYLINYARSFIFTTALPPHSVSYIAKAYEMLRKTNRIELLKQNIIAFKASLNDHVREMILPSPSPIQSLLIKGAGKTRLIAKKIQEKGFDVKPIVSPTVALGKERIRICIHAFNSPAEVASLAESINELLEDER